MPLEQWEFYVGDNTSVRRRWDWESFRKLPTETFTADLHLRHTLIEAWDNLGRSSPDAILSNLETDASHLMVRSYEDYTTNLPAKDLKNHQAWIAFRFDGNDLAPEHGGPARLLVPHLYLWKSAKWMRVSP